MSIFKKPLILGIFCLSLLAPSLTALAYGPILSLSGSGDNVLVNISGAYQNSQIQLSYSQSGSSLPTTISNFGSTDYSGNFSTTVSSSGYGINSGAQVYVTVGGQTSNTVTYSGYGYGGGYSGCSYYGCGGTGSFPLSQTTVSVNIGQSATVTAYNYSGSIYISSNSSPNVATATVSGNQIIFNGLVSGSTSILVCNNLSQCATVYVTVSGSVLGASAYQVYMLDSYFSPNTITVPTGSTLTWTNSGGQVHNVIADNGQFTSGALNPGGSFSQVFNTPGTYYYHCSLHGGMTGTVIVTGSYSGSGSLSFSQNNITLSSGQSQTVSVSAPYGSSVYALYISSNSNSGVASAYVSGSSLVISALSYGSTTIVVCQTGNQCGSLYVTVSSGSYASGLSFSNAYPSLTVGQALTVNIYGSSYLYSQNYYISSNSNPNRVSAWINGSVLNLSAVVGGSGSTAIVVCQTGGSVCGTIYPTVSSGSSGTLTFSQNNLNLSSGQTASVSIYTYTTAGGNYLVNNSNPNVVLSSISGNIINLTATNGGSSTLSVCMSGTSTCGYLYVTVSGYGSGVTLSQSAVNVALGQSVSVTVTSNVPVYVSSNSNPSAFSATLNNNILTVYASSYGSGSVNICQTNNSSQCANLAVTVGYTGGGTGSLIFVTTSITQPTVGQYYGYQLQVTGGYAPYTFTLNSGSLPAGMSLSAAGTIFGTPQSTASATFSVRASDNTGRQATASFTLTPTGGSSVLGATTFTSGTLIQEGSAIYIVYKNTKSGFTNANAFLALGYRFGNVVEVSDSGLINSGYVVTNANIPHPWGTWIKSGAKIYFVYEQGLIPVPSNAVFLNNGGGNIATVPANRYDFAKPILSTMTYNDSRVQ